MTTASRPQEARELLQQVAQYGHAVSREDYDEASRIYNELSAALAASSPVQEAEGCKRCAGSGVVDDGEIDNGYENGPIKCVKDCPACKPVAKDAPTPAVGGLTDDQICKLADMLWEQGHISDLSRDTAVIFARALLAASPVPMASSAGEPEGWRAALEFYAKGNHFVRHEADAWDTVSGEPTNFFEDESNTATVEDGSVAAMALAGTPLPDEDDAPPAASLREQEPLAWAVLSTHSGDIQEVDLFKKRESADRHCASNGGVVVGLAQIDAQRLGRDNAAPQEGGEK